MDTMLMGGDHYTDARGLPVALTGARELLQRALIRLCVRKGSFALDPALGSELHRLRHSESEWNNRLALSYVQEALQGMPEISVASVSCTPGGADNLRVAVSLAVGEELYDLEVNVQ